MDPRNVIPIQRGPVATGSLKLEGGTGEITRMIGFTAFLEVYRCDTTFRLLGPEDHPAPKESKGFEGFVVTRTEGVGTASPAVARTVVQASDMLRLGIFREGFDRDAALAQVHACKELLVICEQLAKKVGDCIVETAQSIATKGVETDDAGRAFNPFPHTPNLDSDVTSFLINAKRAVGQCVELMALMRDVPVKGADFKKVRGSLTRSLGTSDRLVQFVAAEEANAKRVSDLRNYHEHPSKAGLRTVVRDFHLTGTGELCAPLLHLSNEPPRFLHQELKACSNFLVQLVETTFILCCWDSLRPDHPFYISQVPPEKLDPACPVRFRLELDFSRIRMQAPAAESATNDQ